MIYRILRVVSKPLLQSLNHLVLLHNFRNLVSKMAFQYPLAFRDEAVVSKCDSLTSLAYHLAGMRNHRAFSFIDISACFVSMLVSLFSQSGIAA